MTYSESAIGIIITHDRAIQELTLHGVLVEDHKAFYDDLGRLETYSASDVLHWLGY